MSAAASALNWESIEAHCSRAEEPAWLASRRKEAWATYERLPFPTRKEEEWRRTDLRLLPFEGLATLSNGRVKTEEFLSPSSADFSGVLHHTGFTRIQRYLSPKLAEKGVIFTSLEDAARQHPDLLQQYFMTRCIPPDENKFTALHAAIWRAGTFLYVPAGLQIALPFHAILENSSAGAALGPHTLVVVESGSSVTFFDEWHGSGDAKSVYTGVMELFVHRNARLNLISIQQWDAEAFAVDLHRAVLGQDAKLSWATGELGARLAKKKQEVRLEGAGAEAELLGMYFLSGIQHSDLVTILDHQAPHTRGNIMFKGGCTDRARSVFRGTIVVRAEANQTDSFLSDHALLLSENARADSIPILEILARDVRCKHAASMGQVDPEQLFYLQSRGLSEDEALRLIVLGFFEPVIGKIPAADAQERFRTFIQRKLGPS